MTWPLWCCPCRDDLPTYRRFRTCLSSVGCGQPLDLYVRTDTLCVGGADAIGRVVKLGGICFAQIEETVYTTDDPAPDGQVTIPPGSATIAPPTQPECEEDCSACGDPVHVAFGVPCSCWTGPDTIIYCGDPLTDACRLFECASFGYFTISGPTTPMTGPVPDGFRFPAGCSGFGSIGAGGLVITSNPEMACCEVCGGRIGTMSDACGEPTSRCCAYPSTATLEWSYTQRREAFLPQNSPPDYVEEGSGFGTLTFRKDTFASHIECIAGSWAWSYFEDNFGSTFSDSGTGGCVDASVPMCDQLGVTPTTAVVPGSAVGPLFPNTGTGWLDSFLDTTDTTFDGCNFVRVRTDNRACPTLGSQTSVYSVVYEPDGWSIEFDISGAITIQANPGTGCAATGETASVLGSLSIRVTWSPVFPTDGCGNPPAALIAAIEAAVRDGLIPELQAAAEQDPDGLRGAMRGLGDMLARTIHVATFGLVEPCDGCKGRQALLNRLVPFRRRQEPPRPTP